MNKNTILNTISGKLGRTGLKIKKHSPEILIIAGVAGMVTSAVMACKATLKATEILKESKEQLEHIRTCIETKSEEVYSKEDVKKDTTLVCIQTGVKLAKIYAPAVILGVVSITSILTSNRILRKRNVALGAAYAAIDRGFKDYRNRVIERFGEEVDKELKYNVRKEKIEETEIDPETGKEKKVKKTVDVVDSENLGCSPYARFFDASCRPFSKNPETNLYFLRAEQAFANERLRTRGYVSLNEVYERLDIQPTEAGQVVGWVYDENNPNGDNYIDFGIYNDYRAANRKFVNGIEPVILLDFNVDGNILDLIPSHYKS